MEPKIHQNRLRFGSNPKPRPN